MDKDYKIKEKNDVLDKYKGQKIAAALYLVTRHMTDSDPLRQSIRTCATVLAAGDGAMSSVGEKIKNLISVGVFLGTISQQNADIIVSELDRFTAQSADIPSLHTLFVPDAQKDKKEYVHNMSLISNKIYQRENKINIIKDKSKRRDDILSFIKRQKSVGIKDIASLFPDISEKTIQRELTTLISEGKINKRGSKRWSIYVAVF